MKLYKLNKAVLSLRNNPTQFLNGLTSNDLDQPQNAFLSVHGRIIATFEQLKIDEEEYWLVVEQSCVDPLLEHLDKYIKLSSAEVNQLSHLVYFQLDSESTPQYDSGHFLSLKGGAMIISDRDLEANVSQKEFDLFRLKHQFPFQAIDYKDEFILNVGDEDFVSYTKGCFLGQEPVSKVHNRSRPTWQLVVKYENECDEEAQSKMTSKVVDPQTNQVLGFTFIKNIEE